MNKDDEEYSINYLARQAWSRYNPKWLLDKVDEASEGEQDFVYDVTEVREAYYAGFKTGAVYKITKEIPKEGEA